MQKKCMICGEEAKLFVKGSINDCYCEECAQENFADLNYLEKMEDTERKVSDSVDNEKTDSSDEQE